MLDIAFNLQLISCSIMVGVIWIIQLVHYPTFLSIDRTKFKSFEKMHTSSVSLVVVPAMLLELVTAVAIAILEPGYLLKLNLVLLLAIWGVTFVISSRLHKKLLNSFDEKLVKKLISTNWARTALWSIRLVVLFALSLKGS